MAVNSLKEQWGNFFRPHPAMRPFELSVLPLDTVLFPGGLLALTVFDPGCIVAAEACFRNSQSFGVCLAREGTKTGCLVRVTELEREESGALRLKILSGERFHISARRTQEGGPIAATAVAITAEPPQPVPTRLQTCARVLRSIVEKVGAERFAPPLRYDDAAWLGYRLAEALPLKLSAKQNMLEMNDSAARLEILHRFLVQQGLDYLPAP